eukprot:403338701
MDPYQEKLLQDQHYGGDQYNKIIEDEENFKTCNSPSTKDRDENLQRYDQQMIEESEQIFLDWQDINFYVPLKKRNMIINEELQQQVIETEQLLPSNQVQEQNYQLQNNNSQQNFVKNSSMNQEQGPQYPDKHHILKSNSGFSRPGEIMAIMGPSGSGKTSLLNILSQRHNLSKKSIVTGSITANGRSLEKDDFGKFAAFVQQDDVLMITFTPYELFKFAAKMRTNFDDEQIEELVQSVIYRLRLQSCKNTLVGGFFLKGISGGERKRTSIGYELITNPNLLLLDEPTSGLDSTTALQIIKLLKQEARKGMNIICTIHSPSSDIFMQFDRLMMLSEGHTIFNGPANNIQNFLSDFNMSIPRFTNPADFILKIAIDPKIVNQEVTTIMIANKCKQQYQIEKNSLPVRKHNGLKITMIGLQRQASFWIQFKLQFLRTLIYIKRNPRAIYGLFGLSLFMAFLISSVYHDIGSKELDLFIKKEVNTSITMSWLGFVFFSSIDQFICLSMAQILQLPMIKPVYHRERKSKLYSEHSYFLSVLSASTLVLMFYPFCVGLLSYYFIKFDDTSAENIFKWVSVLVIQALNGSFFGFMLGALFDSDQQAILVVNLFMVLFNLGAGSFSNLGNANFVGKFLGWISPMRYSSELLLRRLIYKKNYLGINYSQVVMDYFGYNYGDKVCYSVLIGMMLFYFFMTWLIIYIKTKFL